MVNIGRTNNRNLQTPHNQGLARRADKRIAGIADAHAAKFETALAVDGSVAFVWNRERGTIPCTCRGFKALDGSAESDLGGSNSPTTTTINVYTEAGGGVSRSTVVSPDSADLDGFTYVGEDLTADDLDGFFSGTTVNETPANKIENKTEFVENFHDETGDFPGDNDVLTALSDGYGEVSTPDTDGDPLLNPVSGKHGESSLLLSPTMVQCPICFGSGTIDSWYLYNGERIILDAAGRYKTTMTDVTLDQSQPVRFNVAERASVTWTGVGIPQMWRHLIRLNVYNYGELLDPNDYTFTFVHPNAATPNTLTYKTLSALNKGTLLASGNKLDITITAKDGNPIEFSHIEILFSLGEAVKIQVPEIEVPNQSEFIDWNLSVTFELSSNIRIKENSYISEGKYRRIWKVESINRKLTASGKSFGYSVTARALHSFERAYYLMSVLGEPIDPFSVDVDSLIDDEL